MCHGSLGCSTDPVPTACMQALHTLCMVPATLNDNGSSIFLISHSITLLLLVAKLIINQCICCQSYTDTIVCLYLCSVEA